MTSRLLTEAAAGCYLMFPCCYDCENNRKTGTPIAPLHRAVEAMTQGRARTPKTDDLGQIFFHIRTERPGPKRRSWQRRARIALQTRHPELTPAERHEIIVCWSRQDCARIESHALRKLHPHLNSSPARCEWQTMKARTFMRAGFDAHGQPTRKKKPGIARPTAVAANDPIYLVSTTNRTQCTPQHSAGPCIPAPSAARAAFASRRRRAIQPAPAMSSAGNAAHHAAPSSIRMHRVAPRPPHRLRSRLIRPPAQLLPRTEPRIAARHARTRAMLL